MPRGLHARLCLALLRVCNENTLLCNDGSLLVLFFLFQIVQRYDILLIQEIRDISETTMDILVGQVNTDAGFVSSLPATHMLFTYSLKRLFSLFSFN